MSGEPPPVSEPIALSSTFCDGLHSVEVDRHGIARLVFFAEQREVYSGAMERIVASRLLLPSAVLADIAARLLAANKALQPDPYAERRKAMN